MYIYVIQWQNNLGEWSNSPNATFDDLVDAEVGMDWLQEECPRLWASFPHRIVRVFDDGRVFPVVRFGLVGRG